MASKPFALSVKAVALDARGRCLLLKRPLDSRINPGKWEFPGGKAEMGEKFDEALLRETWEESGLNIVLQRVAGAAEFELPELRIAYIIMEGLLESGEVRLSDEHTEFAWVPVSQVLDMDLAEQFVMVARSYVVER